MRNPWTVVTLAILIVFARLLTGTWKGSDWLWIALMVLLGMVPLLTPIMAGLGLLGLIIIFIKRGGYAQLAQGSRGSFFQNLKSLFPV